MVMLKFKFIFVLFLSLCVSYVHAEQKKQVGQFEIHYMALKSTFLTKEIAHNYQIDRGHYTGILNISILDTSQRSNPPVHADITGYATNISASKKPLKFKEIRDQGAIYYVAQFSHEHEEHLTFHVQIKSQDKLDTKFKFKKTFYNH